MYVSVPISIAFSDIHTTKKSKLHSYKHNYMNINILKKIQYIYKRAAPIG